MNDVIWALRRLTRRAGFSAVFVSIMGATLAISLTIGAVARATIGASLPYEEGERLYALYESNPSQQIDDLASSYASAIDWRERTRAFESFGMVRPQLNLTLQAPDGVARVSGAIVSASMFETLRVRPVLGRPFNAEEDVPEAMVSSVILSHRIWSERFGEDPEVVGRSVVLNGSGWTVVGVLPPGQPLAPTYLQPVDVWLPLGTAGVIVGPPVYSNRLYRMFTIIARLRGDASHMDAETDASALSAGLAADHPDASEGWQWHAVPLRTRVLSGVDAPIRALFAGGLLLFLVAVVNLLALHVLRLRAEHGDLATRLAVGASSADLVRLGLVELLLLGGVAGAIGTGLAALAVGLLPHWMPVALPPHVEVDFGVGLAALGVGASVGALLLVGLIGMSVALRGIERSAAAGGRVVGESRGSSRISQSSLAAQIALSTFLAIGSAIALRSFMALGALDAGVDATGLTALRVDVPAELRTPEEVVVTADEILRNVRAMPGVQSAFVWSPHVPAAATWYTRVRLMDRPEVPDSELPTVRFHTVSAGAVTDLGLEIVAGRDFTQQDLEAGRRVMMVSASAARAWWGDEAAAVGRAMQRWSHQEWSEVVGVVADAPLSGRQGDGSDFFTDVFFLFGQDMQRDLVFLARAQPGARVSAEELRAAVRTAASDLPPYDIRTMEARLADQDALSRSSAWLSGLFATTAVLLAAIGLYSGLSFVVGRKRREIGVRQALGASPGRVVRELVRGGLAVVLLGTLSGVLLAWYGLPSIDSTLLIVGVHDAFSYAAATVVLLVTSVVALLSPSLRALRATPSESLRQE